MIRRTLDLEVGSGGPGRRDLGAHAGETRCEGPIGQARVVATDGLVEGGRARFIERVVHPVGPLHVRAEPGPAGQVDRQMRAEAARHRDRVDEVPEGRTSGHHEIVAFGEVLRSNGPGRDALDLARHLRCPRAGAIDHQPEANGGRVPVACGQLDAVRTDPAREHGRRERDLRP